MLLRPVPKAKAKSEGDMKVYLLKYYPLGLIFKIYRRGDG